MWQLAMLWSLMPDWLITVIVNGLIIVGLVGISASWIARWVPYFNLYRGPIQVIGIICLVLGVYFRGGADVETSWRERVREMEQRIAVAEQKSRVANAELSRRMQENRRLIEQNRQAISARIEKNRTEINDRCSIPAVAQEIVNQAAEMTQKKDQKGSQK